MVVFDNCVQYARAVLRRFFSTGRLAALRKSSVECTICLQAMRIRFTIYARAINVRDLANVLIATTGNDLVIRRRIIIRRFFICFRSFTFNDYYGRYVCRILLRNTYRSIQRNATFHDNGSITVRTVRRLCRHRDLFTIRQFILRRARRTIITRRVPGSVKLNVLRRLYQYVFRCTRQDITRRMNMLSRFYIRRPFEVNRRFVRRRLRNYLLLLFLRGNVNFLSISRGHILCVSAASVYRCVVGVVIPLISGHVM